MNKLAERTPQAFLTPRATWETYTANVAVSPVEAMTTIALGETIQRIESDHVAKEAPRFTDQVAELDRTNPVTYISGEKRSLMSEASNDEFEGRRTTVTEHQALLGLYNTLAAVAVEEDTGRSSKNKAQSLMDTLTFIGEKEYKQATKGIAEYWKAQLEANKNLQIYPVSGEIAKSDSLYQSRDAHRTSHVKSDEYMLEAILANFSDDELSAYAGRLIVDEHEMTAVDPKNLKIVLLDDWMISGGQIGLAEKTLASRYPELESSFEIQLIVSNEERIKNGFHYYGSRGEVERSTPVRAYYKSHASTAVTEYGSHVTGFHSSVDFDFELSVDRLVGERGTTVAEMPPLTNIVRPYRMEGYELTQKERVRRTAKQARGHDMSEG